MGGGTIYYSISCVGSGLFRLETAGAKSGFSDNPEPDTPYRVSAESVSIDGLERSMYPEAFSPHRREIMQLTPESPALKFKADRHFSP